VADGEVAVEQDSAGAHGGGSGRGGVVRQVKASGSFLKKEPKNFYPFGFGFPRGRAKPNG
jgi:hypothetical protein